MSALKFTITEYSRIGQLVRDGYLTEVSRNEFTLTMKGVAVLLAEAESPIMKPAKGTGQ